MSINLHFPLNCSRSSRLYSPVTRVPTCAEPLKLKLIPSKWSSSSQLGLRNENIRHSLVELSINPRGSIERFEARVCLGNSIDSSKHHDHRGMNGLASGSSLALPGQPEHPQFTVNLYKQRVEKYLRCARHKVVHSSGEFNLIVASCARNTKTIASSPEDRSIGPSIANLNLLIRLGKNSENQRPRRKFAA